MFNLNDMAIFTRVVEAGSFTAAGKLLGLPKSTVSRKIALLEETLGVRLLERTTRALKLTEIGTGYFEQCARIVGAAEEANLAVSQMQATPKGKLRITAPTEFGSLYLGEAVAGYLQQYPQVQIEVELTNRVVDLIDEGFDLAIRAGALPDSSLIARKLAGEGVFICASPAYLEKHGRPLSPEDLASHQVILSPATPHGKVKLISDQGESAAAGIRGSLQVNSLAMARDAAVAGLGLVALPEMICWEDLRSGRLSVALEGWKLPGTGIYAVYPSPRHLSIKVKTFIDFLQQSLTPPPWKSA
ncbi:transcriptional regulator [Desulfuromonas versatilis]|uniref:Transcriptional regulator n=1 Tax=Desulfuromonas versatilis TaxID=2802975 RepID=A0ABN6DW55_9BACT|nr:LysR family transcriptional regulator [Desulfuromonas versatilis]BCR04351.1 transcriptional regulator [Desulfuromonas versatilis]